MSYNSLRVETAGNKERVWKSQLEAKERESKALRDLMGKQQTVRDMNNSSGLNNNASSFGVRAATVGAGGGGTSCSGGGGGGSSATVQQQQQHASSTTAVAQPSFAKMQELKSWLQCEVHDRAKIAQCKVCICIHRILDAEMLFIGVDEKTSGSPRCSAALALTIVIFINAVVGSDYSDRMSLPSACSSAVRRRADCSRSGCISA